MPGISNLKIKWETGKTGSLLATWEFDGIQVVDGTTTVGGTVTSGSWVQIASDAVWYNGVSIDSWVLNSTGDDALWKVIDLDGDRAVLGTNKSGTHNIVSPINTKYLTTEDSSTTTETTTTSSVDTSTLDHYTVRWDYYTGDNVWFSGNENTTQDLAHTYSPPDNALRVRCTVTPVSKTYKETSGSTTEERSYWTGTPSSTEFSSTTSTPADISSISDVSISKNVLRAVVSNVSDAKTTKIEFQIYKRSSTTNSDGTSTESDGLYKTGQATVSACRAAFTATVDSGGIYRVRCRAVNVTGGVDVPANEWSDFSSDLASSPAAPNGFTSIYGASETSVHLEWNAVLGANYYEIEYATERRYFDNTDATSTVSNITTTTREITGLQSGDEYFFRIRAIQNQNGAESEASPWSEIASVVIGEKPAAPTTWSSTSKLMVGETLYLYWVHNARDGSSERYAQVEYSINGVKQAVHTQTKSTDKYEKDKTGVWDGLSTGSLREGAKIEWRVRTAGETKEFGDWSVMRTVEVFAAPTLQLQIRKTTTGSAVSSISSYPFYISGVAGPSTQTPMSYTAVILANDSYVTLNNRGETVTVNKGDIVYTTNVDTNSALLLEITAASVNLMSGMSYTVRAIVSMNSGLTATSEVQLKVEFAAQSYLPHAEIRIDRRCWAAYIRPFCQNGQGQLIDGISLAVYRMEYDGTFTEIASDLNNTSYEFVTDPHPALDYARYRIVSTVRSTGAIGFADVPALYVGCKSIIVQWDEVWKPYKTDKGTQSVDPAWSGSLIDFPYNIDTTEKTDVEVELVKYIGRDYPVAYHGTQKGETATWKTVIPKYDEATIYALRRLMKWMGRVYVREPSGVGYWATIKVQFSRTHAELTIPISLTITRVEGGI